MDTDIDHYLVSYSIGEETKVTDVEVTDTAYILSEIETESGTYTFTVKAVDKAGNESEESSTSVTPAKVLFVSRIELDRSHIAYNDTVKVTVYGSNFDLIQEQDDKTIKIQLDANSWEFLDTPDGNLYYDATVDIENNKATAIIIPPIKESTSGIDYIIRAKICGTIDYDHIATLNISSPASVTSISFSTSHFSVEDVLNGTTTTAVVEGKNLDATSTITMQFYDSMGKAYGDAVLVDTSKFKMHETSFTAEIPVPTIGDLYTLKVLFDGTEQWEWDEAETVLFGESLLVYGAPTFTSFKIPKAGISREDRTVTAFVTGKNFTTIDGDMISDSIFIVTCTSNPSIVSESKVDVLSDSKLTVTLTIPGTVGDYTVKIARGNKSCEGTFTVKDYSDYKNGQIVLADGTLVEPSAYTSIDRKNPPVAVVSIDDNGVALGVGLHIPSETLKWAPEGTNGYNIKFTAIYCGSNGDGDSFIGDTDGSDNWDVICSVAPEGSADAETNYPAFYWANNYGTMYKDYLGSMIEDWYIPSAAELYKVGKNSESINESLLVINGLDSS